MKAATGATDRIPLLDIIRGMALCGILLANLTSFFGASTLTRDERAVMPLASGGAAVLFTIDWLIEGKFYSLFSLLLGAGFALQHQRAASGIRAFDTFFRRRMLVLIAIGAAHMVALWSGDILLLYGLMGLTLPALARLSTRSQLRVAAVLFTIPVVTHIVVNLSSGALDPRAPFAAASQDLRTAMGYADRSARELFVSPQPWDVWASNLFSVVTRPGTYLQAGRPAKVLALFLLGAWLATAVLPRLDNLRRQLRITVVLGAAVGLSASFVYARIKADTGSTFLVSPLGLLQTLAYNVGTTPLALAYASAVALLWMSPRWQPRLQVFAVLGRMALTVYLMQTVVQLAIFSGFGLGLSGRVPFAYLPIVALAILVLQHRMCSWWLARFGQGPMEHMWRRLTYAVVSPSP